MTIQQSPTYMGLHLDGGFWAFSPSPILNVDFVWDISDWSFDQITDFMNLPSEGDRMAVVQHMKPVGGTFFESGGRDE